MRVDAGADRAGNVESAARSAGVALAWRRWAGGGSTEDLELDESGPPHDEHGDKSTGNDRSG
jgi:hypothetical protein